MAYHTIFDIRKNNKMENLEKFIFLTNVRHFVIFAYIKNRMICATAVKILNLKPFDFFVSDDPPPRFNQQRSPRKKTSLGESLAESHA